MTIRAAYYTLRKLLAKRGDGCADIDHLANVVSLRARDVVEFENYRVALTAIDARRIDQHLCKVNSVFRARYSR